jgi:hypothetical protein
LVGSRWSMADGSDFMLCAMVSLRTLRLDSAYSAFKRFLRSHLYPAHKENPETQRNGRRERREFGVLQG